MLGTPEPCHVLKDAEEKRGFICTSSMPSAASRLAKQTDETAFSGWIRGRFGRICLQSINTSFCTALLPQIHLCNVCIDQKLETGQ